MGRALRPTLHLDQRRRTQDPRGSGLALRRLRLANRPRVLWIDAVCIDQANVAERNAQVLQMPVMYSRAGKVLAYLRASNTHSSVRSTWGQTVEGSTREAAYEQGEAGIGDAASEVHPLAISATS